MFLCIFCLRWLFASWLLTFYYPFICSSVFQISIFHVFSSMCLSLSVRLSYAFNMFSENTDESYDPRIQRPKSPALDKNLSPPLKRKKLSRKLIEYIQGKINLKEILNVLHFLRHLWKENFQDSRQSVIRCRPIGRQTIK